MGGSRLDGAGLNGDLGFGDGVRCNAVHHVDAYAFVVYCLIALRDPSFSLFHPQYTFFFSSTEIPPGPMLTSNSKPPTMAGIS